MGLTDHSPFWQRIGLVRPPLWQCWHMALVLHRRSSSRRCSPSSSRCTAYRRPSCSQRCGSIVPQNVFLNHPSLCAILQVPAFSCASAEAHVVLVLHRRSSNHRSSLNSQVDLQLYILQLHLRHTMHPQSDIERPCQSLSACWRGPRPEPACND